MLFYSKASEKFEFLWWAWESLFKLADKEHPACINLDLLLSVTFAKVDHVISSPRSVQHVQHWPCVGPQD